MATTDFKCELSWSASRAREFQRCRRENWYARYASWGWWKEKPPGRRFEAMVHKNLTSLAAFAGDCVHRAVARWFDLRRAGTSMTGAELYEDARDRFRAGWRQSQGGEWERQPNRSVHLEEHHYRTALDRGRTDGIRDRLQACARNFLGMAELEPVRNSHPEDWLAVEELDTYRFLGTKIYAVPDFALRQGDEVHIYDWKTGRPAEADIFQLHTYALYACEKWHADPESVVMHAVYLTPGETKRLAGRIDTLSEAQDRISDSLRAMIEVHYDPDEEGAVMSNWTASGAPAQCGHCRFRGICEAAPQA